VLSLCAVLCVVVLFCNVLCCVQSSGSIVADPQSYPRPLKNKVSSALSKLLLKAAEDARKPQSFRLAKGGALDRPKGTHASR
jgi:hypothetical protein